MKLIVDNKVPYIRGGFERIFRQNSPETDLIVEYLAPEEITRERVRDADGLIVRTRTRCNESLLAGSAVKAIATATIGTDHIDTSWCGSNGIAVFNAAGCNAPAVADYVFFGGLNGRIKGEGRTLGVVGAGNIGRIVALTAMNLGWKVIMNDPPRKEAGLIDFDYAPLEELLQESDVVTLHTPLARTGNHPTYHLMGERELALMKEGALLINAARGGIVDEMALRDAMENKNLKAVIDVWENEPHINRELLEKALLATPHIAGYSIEGKQRAALMTLNSISGFFIPGFNLSVETLTIVSPESPVHADADELEEAGKTVMRRLAHYSDSLKNNPGDFEAFRENYPYRHEVLRSV